MISGELTMNIVTNATFSLQTDLEGVPPNASGIVHASNPNNEGHVPIDAFMWLADMNISTMAVGYWTQLGYEADDISFIPFSSKENWIKTYPSIVPTLECDEQGNIFAFSTDSATAAAESQSKVALPTIDTKPSSASNSKKRKRGGPRIYKTAVLTNDVRDELHIQIYRYFQWLARKLIANQTTFNGRLKLNDSGLTLLGIQSMLSAMESIFDIVKTVQSSFEPNFLPSAEDDAPLLESALEFQLGTLTDVRLEKSNPDPYHAQWYDFDEMLTKLQEYKRHHGNCNVPSRYMEDRRLGKWVQKLREKKTDLEKKGEEYETPKGKLTGRSLTQERIAQLDALDFEWRLKTKPSVPWETRFEELVEFYHINGRWPSRKNDGAIGVWTHNQRNFYTKKDKHFMGERFAKMDAIGFDWDPTGKKAAKELSWSDGFGRLVDFGRSNGHYNVPPPVDRRDQEATRFYRWVQSLHMEHRALQNGQQSRLLDGVRVSALVNIGFGFQM